MGTGIAGDQYDECYRCQERFWGEDAERWLTEVETGGGCARSFCGECLRTEEQERKALNTEQKKES